MKHKIAAIDLKTSDMKNNNEDENWIDKCMSCIHCYIRKDDADTLHCWCRDGCHYKSIRQRNNELWKVSEQHEN